MTKSKAVVISIITAFALLGTPHSLARKEPQDTQPGSADATHVYELLVGDGIVYVARTNSFTVFDFAEPARPREIGRLTVQAAIREISLDGTRAYLAGGSRGILVVDVTDPAKPLLLEQIDTPGTAYSVIHKDGFLFIADGGEGLRVLELPSSLRAHKISSFSSSNKIQSLALSVTMASR